MIHWEVAALKSSSAVGWTTYQITTLPQHSFFIRKMKTTFVYIDGNGQLLSISTPSEFEINDTRITK